MKATNGSIKRASAASPLKGQRDAAPTVPPRESDVVYDEGGERNDNISGHEDGTPEMKKGRLVKKIERINRFVDETLVGLDPFTALLWLALYRMEKNCIATATHGRLAKRMGVSKRTVARHIKVLIANRLLRQVHTGGFGRGFNTYQFGLRRLAKDNPLKAYKAKSGPNQKPVKPKLEKPASSKLLRRKPK